MKIHWVPIGWPVFCQTAGCKDKKEQCLIPGAYNSVKRLTCKKKKKKKKPTPLLL